MTTKSEANFLSFTVNQNVTIYLAYDSRVSTRPNRMAGWTDTGNLLGTTDVAHRLYSQSFPAGFITLGANQALGASGAGSNYSVAIVPQSGSTSPPSGNQPPR